jgi:hypothetical protein
MRSKLLIVLLCLFVLTPLVTAKWVRFEAENAILTGLDTRINSFTDASGGEAVFINNSIPTGLIDFVVNVREPNTFAMRVGFSANSATNERYDSFRVNDLANAYVYENWACGYYWDPYPRPNANFDSFRSSIVTYGTQAQFQILSRWWAKWNESQRDIPMTVPLISGKNTIRIESRWGNTYYDYIELDLPETAYDPDPADGDQEVRSTQTTLSWMNPAGVVKNEVYFGQSDTEPNASNYKTILGAPIVINNPGTTPSMAMPTTLVDGKKYCWAVDSFDSPASEPNFPGVVWSFNTQFNAAPVVTIETPYPYLVGGTADVSLNATVIDDGAIASYLWEQVSGPVSAVINSPATEDTTITVIEESGNDTPYVFRLTVSDGVRTGTATVTFYVDDTPCEAARRKPGTRNIADINYNCRVEMGDFAGMASVWLNCLDTVTGNNCN